MMNFESPDYLTHTEKRLDHLRRLVAGRPVAILAAGPSVKELEKRIYELAQADICYFGINNFYVQEEHILKKINKHFSVLIESTDNTNGAFADVFNKVLGFLDRAEDGILVSFFNHFGVLGPDFDLKNFLNKYDHKLFSPGNGGADRTVPNNSHPLHFINGNSLSWMIYLAIISKASKIVLFGADGYNKHGSEETYYRTKEYGQYYTDQNQILINNTNKGFNPIVPISLRNIYNTYNLQPIPILNCSAVSFYTPFPKVTYDDAFDFLLDKKSADKITDLRIPTASIIIPYSKNDKELENTIDNIEEQSYSNYEKLLIQRKDDLDFLEIMEKALSSARGKYIFYCPSGSTLPDHNWINSCLEILENRPQISLVSGWPKNIELPWPKKGFLYYWLKKKTFFKENVICIRKEILKKCLFQADRLNAENEFENWLNFNLRFNKTGYLPAFIPITAELNQLNSGNDKSLNTYRQRINEYKKELIFRKRPHSYKDGEDNVLPGKFYLSVLLFYGLAKKVKNKLHK